MQVLCDTEKKKRKHSFYKMEQNVKNRPRKNTNAVKKANARHSADFWLFGFLEIFWADEFFCDGRIHPWLSCECEAVSRSLVDGL